MKPIILISGLLFGTIANAEIYEIIDANGHKNYTDKPPLEQPDAKPVTVAPNTGNAWQNDSLQQSNDQYFDELLQKRSAQSEKENAEKEKQAAIRKQLADRISEAEEALTKAKELQSGDYYPNQQGGLRYTQEYRDRVKAAEKKLEQAKEEAAKNR